MAMNFFEHQDQARKKTGRLVFLFILAVVTIVLSLYAVAMALVLFNYDEPISPAQPSPGWWQPAIFAAVALGTLVVVGVGSLVQLAALRQGGSAVARMLGGRLISTNTHTADERKILNVVQEMAIASGTPVPPVYMIEETGINAFAAGYSPSDAVIGVTRGCVEQLSRDELQGVMAHEFSHILNGDMRLNIRLISIIAGITGIATVGYVIFRVGLEAHDDSSDDKGSGQLMIVLAGIAVMIIGYAGMFFGNLIKAAISRQREFLADASAVQFTRNPQGIAGALKRIGGFKRGSKIANAHASEISHMFFSNAFSPSLMHLFATHPPLAQRIKRIDPTWDGKMTTDTVTSDTGSQAMGFAGEASGRATTPATAMQSVGNLSEAHMAYAASLLAGLPQALRESSQEPFGSRAVMYSLLLSGDPQVRSRQLDHLKTHADAHVYELTRTMLASLQNVSPAARCPLVELALPALKQLSPDQYRAFRDNIEMLIRADDRIDLFEWTLNRMLRHHLDPEFAHVAKQDKSTLPAAVAMSILLSGLARVGSRDEAAITAAFAQGRDATGMTRLQLASASACRLDQLDLALNAAAKLPPRGKQRLLTGCAACIAADREITVAEGELLRAIADALDCPMPPLLPGQPLV